MKPTKTTRPTQEPTPRSIQTPEGTIPYELTHKRVRNLNLRIRRDGTVAVSAPTRMPQREIDAFLRQKAGWITGSRQKMLARPPETPCRYSREECLEIFTQASDAVFPLFSDLLGGARPAIRVREMKSRWGSCNVKKRVLTFNTRLAEKPREALEYVVLHEYVHFLHPNHGPGFHAEMARLMPDYRHRRKLLAAEP